MIKGIDHIHLVTPDIDGAIDFYTDALGFSLHRRVKRIQADGTPFEVAYLRLRPGVVRVA